MIPWNEFLRQVAEEVEVELDRLLPVEQGPERRLYSAMRYSPFCRNAGGVWRRTTCLDALCCRTGNDSYLFVDS